MLESKYVQFSIISSLLFSIIVDIFEVDPHSIQYGKRLVKPTNSTDGKQRLFNTSRSNNVSTVPLLFPIHLITEQLVAPSTFTSK